MPPAAWPTSSETPNRWAANLVDRRQFVSDGPVRVGRKTIHTVSPRESPRSQNQEQTWVVNLQRFSGSTGPGGVEDPVRNGSVLPVTVLWFASGRRAGLYRPWLRTIRSVGIAGRRARSLLDRQEPGQARRP